jgi:predicted dehydrogenase
MHAKRVGLMGCGNVASYGHIPAILATPGLDRT